MAEAAATPPEAPAAAAQPGVWIDPYRAYNFKLVIQGVTMGHFTECTGLGVRVQALRYGLTSSTELWTWFMTGVEGHVERRNVSVLMLDTDDVTEALRWDLINAWPSEWRGAPLDALGREVAIESMTLVFESLQRA